MKTIAIYLTLALTISISCKSKQEASSRRSNFKETTMDNSVTEKYWKLIALDGQSFTMGKSQKEIHMILKNKDSLVTGFGGCNNFSGTYELNGEIGGLKFSKMKTTLMACDNMQTEDMFHNVLSKVDNYSIKNDTLSLSKARMAPLAKFKAVYLK